MEESEMDVESKAAELRSVQMVSTAFHGFDDDDVHVLATAMQVVPFKAGDQILQKGEAATWFGILLQGYLDVLINSSAGLVFQIRRGAIFGEQVPPSHCFA